MRLNLKNKFKITFIIICSLLSFILSSTEEGLDKIRKEDFNKKTIAELFDIGGKPTGAWFMSGMPWPADELKKRPADDVKAEAIKRLKTVSKQPHDQVFAVHCLIENFPESEIKTILYKAYPKADSKAQYEILLYACERNLSSFRKYFFDILKNRKKKISRIDMLAVLFFTACPDEQALEYIKKIDLNKIKDGYILDGFPYSDVVSHSIDNPRERINEALKLREDTKMSPEEKALTKKTRSMILKPKKSTLVLNDATVVEALAILNANYEQKTNSNKKLGIKGINLKIKKATLHETLATICNANRISISEQMAGFSAYNAETDNYYYWAKQGVLMGLRFSRGFGSSNKPNASCPIGIIDLNLGIPWLNIEDTRLSDIKITMPDNSVIICENKNYFSTNLTKEEYLKKGGYIKELTAQIQIPVPITIRRKTLSYDEAKDYKSIDFGRRVRIEISKTNEEEYLVTFESKLLFRGQWAFPNTSRDLGTIIMLDANKKQILGSYQSFSNLKSGYTVRISTKPESFQLTVTTKLEYIETPISFKNIKLQDDVWQD